MRPSIPQLQYHLCEGALRLFGLVRLCGVVLVIPGRFLAFTLMCWYA